MDAKMSNLTVCIDFNSIETYLSLASTLELKKIMTEEINWLPIAGGMKKFSNKKNLNNTEPDTELERFKSRRQAARDRYMLMNRCRYAQLLGLSAEDAERHFNSNTAAIGLLWVKKIDSTRIPTYLEAVFLGHYRHHQSVENEDIIVDLLKKAGIESKGFSEFLAAEGVDLMASIQDELAESGVFSSPAYILNAERFQGREHLPLIRWYLRGQDGLPPV